MTTEMLVVVSDPDPVAKAVAALWGDLPSVGMHVEGAPLRRLSPTILTLGRRELHVLDDGLDLKLPAELRQSVPTLVFPSIHRSEQNIPSLTVHPLGNPGPKAEVGGRPRSLVPADPRRMAAGLRLLSESSAGISATFESTHHGPSLGLPAFFIEIGFGILSAPPPEAVSALASVIPRIAPDPKDRVALAVGGGHYAPHFTELCLRRRWAFGHILSRHSFAEADRRTVESAYAETPAAEGILFTRAEDAKSPLVAGLAPRLREQDAPLRSEGTNGSKLTDASRSASGT